MTLTLKNVAGWERPVGASEKDPQVGEDELGNPTFMMKSGQKYSVKLNMDQRTTRKKVEDTIAGGLRMPTLREVGDLAVGAIKGLGEVIDTPRAIMAGEKTPTVGSGFEVGGMAGVSTVPFSAPVSAIRSFGGSAKKNVIAFDNPGGNWLLNKQRRVEEDMKTADPDTFSSKGLSGPTTAYTKEPVMVPIELIKEVKGALNENRKAGDPRFDELMEKVSQEGFDPLQKGNAIVIGVNHKGEAFILEGNTRLAVAKELGLTNIRAEVRWYNGGEEVVGPLTPKILEGSLSPVLLKEVGELK